MILLIQNLAGGGGSTLTDTRTDAAGVTDTTSVALAYARTQTDSVGLVDTVTPDLQSPPATPDLSYDFNNGTDGVLLAPGDTPSAGDDAFTSITTNTGSGGVYSYSNLHPAHGSLGVVMQTVATSVSCYAQWDITGSGLNVYSRFYIYIPSGTTLGTRLDIWQYRDAATRTRQGLSTSFQMVAVNGSTVVATSTATLAVDTMYRIEGKMVIDASAGIIEMKLFAGDSTTAIETITATGLNTGTVECTNLRMGNPFATANLGPIYLDDFGVSYTGYMGPALGGSAFTDTRTDNVGLVDTTLPVMAYARTQTDVAGLVDTFSAALAYARTQNDSTGLTDALSAALAYARTLDDSAGLTDSFSTQLGKLITFDDPAGLTDSVARDIAYARAQTDIAGLVDTVARALAYARTQNDVAGLTDTIAASLGRNETLNDVVGLTDAIVTGFIFNLALTDIAGITDDLSFELGTIVVEILRSFTDDSGVIDAVSFVLSQTLFTFTPPSRRHKAEQGERPHGLWMRLGMDVGMSVLRFGSSFRLLEDPDPADITAADAAYLGGRSYLISQSEKDLLVSAGYGAFIV